MTLKQFLRGLAPGLKFCKNARMKYTIFVVKLYENTGLIKNVDGSGLGMDKEPKSKAWPELTYRFPFFSFMNQKINIHNTENNITIIYQYSQSAI